MKCRTPLCLLALLAPLWIVSLSHCTSIGGAGGTTISSTAWGTGPGGESVKLFTLTNASGMEARITNYGGILVSLKVPDKAGELADVVLGFDSLDRYLAPHPFFGTITGRYANRIGGAAFTLDGVRHHVTANAGTNHIHGGQRGFDKQVWNATTRPSKNGVSLILQHTSPDGAEGFPGTLQCEVIYTLTSTNALEIDYRATSDATTVVNLTNHSYFNLAGEGSGSVLNHRLRLQSDAFTATNDSLIPTGAIEPVYGTPLDFTTEQALGSRINDSHPALRHGKGYDHNFVITGRGLREVARLTDPASGRVMTVKTTEPGIQLYTANGLKSVQGKNGHVYGPRHAVCLETQHYPDSPNHPAFPSTTLRPGDSYQSTTVFAFSTQ